MFSPVDAFPMHSPIVSFTGLVIGSGLTLLLDEITSQLGEDQEKLCGFVQLTTYIAPENPNKTPFKGFHPFQVFIIWPIHMKPWSIYYQKMLDGGESPFQPGISFSCTGKVAGFLNHGIMVNPPHLKQDRVFIVVPDSWKFLSNASRPSRLFASPSLTKWVEDPYDRSTFMTPSKQGSSFTSSCLYYPISSFKSN